MAPPKLLQRYHMRRSHAECMPKYHPNQSDSLLVTDGTYPSSDYDRKHHAIPQVAQREERHEALCIILSCGPPRFTVH